MPAPITSLPLIVLLLGLLISCEKEAPEIETEDIYAYEEPNYPMKQGGRFLRSIYYNYPEINNLDYPFESGTKVEFFYNSKNYVDYFKVYGFGANSEGRVVKIEYNIQGLVNRIKYFSLDSTIIAYELFKYDSSKRLLKISNYEQKEEHNNYELVNYSDFKYPSNDTIIQYMYAQYDNFEQAHKEVYIYSLERNIKEKYNYKYRSEHPYLSSEFFYNDKKRPFENLDLPIYEIAYDKFGLSEVFSTNHQVGFQSYSYDNDGVKVEVGGTQIFDYKYDDLGFPISRDESIYYGYIDL
ncbi:hypothetical protein [Mangrovibacterium lignilyticum]|uniref:hypothetical protein n=1 Tax=Mangrovibacterium lignilyticum TaxID=2668052 RepID=UPI0013D0DF62|nr:hypothetical protein [Mangrovibacterium lignilyticum]